MNRLSKILILSILVLTALPVTASGYRNINDATAACGQGNVTVDFACERQLIIDPNTDCGRYICEGDEGVTIDSDNVADLNFFGVRISAKNGNLLQTMFFVGFNLFLGVVALTLAFYGIRGAYIRVTAETGEANAKANKILTNAVFGLIIIGASFIIAQLAASFIGVGSINELVDFNTLNLQTESNPSEI